MQRPPSPTPPPTLKSWVWSFDDADPHKMLRVAVAALDLAAAAIRRLLGPDSAQAAPWVGSYAEREFGTVSAILEALRVQLADPQRSAPVEASARFGDARVVASRCELNDAEASTAQDPRNLLEPLGPFARAVADACEIAAWSQEAALAEPGIDAAEAQVRAESGPIMALWKAVWHARRVEDQRDAAMLHRLQGRLADLALGGGRGTST